MVKTYKRNVAGATAESVIDKTSLCIVLTTVIIILIVVVTGICVKILLNETLSRIILISFICFLGLFGVLSLVALEIRRRKSNKAANKIQRIVPLRSPLNFQYQTVTASAPRDTSWEYSNRETIPA